MKEKTLSSRQLNYRESSLMILKEALMTEQLFTEEEAEYAVSH